MVQFYLNFHDYPAGGQSNAVISTRIDPRPADIDEERSMLSARVV
jgi:hypothetical protein